MNFNMDFKLFWALFSIVLTVIVFIPYIWDIFKKKTQPHIYTWLIWGILQSVATAAVLKGGGGYGSWSIAVGAFFCLSIFGLAFKYGTKNIKKFDLYCLIGAFLALIVYFLINNPLYSIILVATIDFTAFLPTFRKGYEEPYTETLLTFMLSALGNAISILALQNYSVTTMLYLITLFLTNSAFCIILLIGRNRTKKNN